MADVEPIDGVRWFDTHEKDDLAHWLYANGDFTQISDAIDFYQEPWHWNDEYLLWQAELRMEAA